jgi:hypothetical protein
VGDAFNEKEAALTRIFPEWFERLVRRRIVPAASFLDAVESEDCNEAFRSFTFQSLNFVAGTGNLILGTKSGQRFGYLFRVLLHSRGVACFIGISFDFRNDVGRVCLHLLRKIRPSWVTMNVVQGRGIDSNCCI